MKGDAIAANEKSLLEKVNTPPASGEEAGDCACTSVVSDQSVSAAEATSNGSGSKDMKSSNDGYVNEFSSKTTL